MQALVVPVPKAISVGSCYHCNGLRTEGIKRILPIPTPQIYNLIIVIWVVVKIIVPFWIPMIIRHLIFRVPKKGP